VHLGLSSEKGYLPIDGEFFISQKQVQASPEGPDGRRPAARRYRQARDQTKPQLAIAMLKRAWRGGIRAPDVVADSWYGTRFRVQSVVELGLEAVFRMKKSQLQYRLTRANGKPVRLNARARYRSQVRHPWRRVSGMPWKSVALPVELNLGTKKQPQWWPVRLWFVRALKEDGQGSKKDWSWFLSSDESLDEAKILQVYAWRWAIEVYFKECKQHWGYWKQPTRSFASHMASLHLSAIRDLLLVDCIQQGVAESLGEVRKQMNRQLQMLSYAQQFWDWFRSLVHAVLPKPRHQLAEAVDVIFQEIDPTVQAFILRSLQLDETSLRQERRAEAFSG